MALPLSQGLGRVWRAYEGALERRPVLVQAATSTVLWGVGEVTSQRLSGRPLLEWQRVGLSAAYGGAFIGPVGEVWYKALDTLVGRRFAPGSGAFIASKVALDMLTFAPIHVLVFFSYMTLAQGGSWQEVEEKLRSDFLPTYAAELAFWTVFQTANFRFVPVRHQLLAVNVGCLADAVALCWRQGGLMMLGRIQGEKDWFPRLVHWLERKAGWRGPLSADA